MAMSFFGMMLTNAYSIFTSPEEIYEESVRPHGHSIQALDDAQQKQTARKLGDYCRVFVDEQTTKGYRPVQLSYSSKKQEFTLHTGLFVSYFALPKQQIDTSYCGLRRVKVFKPYVLRYHYGDEDVFFRLELDPTFDPAIAHNAIYFESEKQP